MLRASNLAMLTSETKRRINNCRDILVGKLPQPSNQVELITLALIYKFMDDLDEESVQLGGKRSFFTDALANYRWRALLPQTVSADERMTRFARGIELLGGAELEVKGKRIVPAAHLPGLFRDIFRNSFLKFRDGLILTMFLTEVNGFAYSHSEELGNAFEFLLKESGAQGENGQFRTPRHIIDFIVACLDPQPGDKILDPACGTDGFLVSAFKHILAQHTSPGSTMPGDKLTHAQRQKLYGNLAGYDVDDQMVKLSKVNLFLHGFPDPAIHIYDTLSNDARWHEKADLILANPPFMTPKGGVTPHTKFRIAAKKAEVLFTDYIAEHLSGDGRGGVIVPNGIVATTQNAYVKLRRFLVEDSLVAVVSLPAGVFKPYSGVKTSILLLDKKLARQTKEILFLKITADGFDLGDKRNPIEANDLPEAERVVKAWFKSVGQAKAFEPEARGGVTWQAVERKQVLELSGVPLNAERFADGEAGYDGHHDTAKLGDLLEIQSGFPFKSELFNETEGFPLIRIRNINPSSTTTEYRGDYAPEYVVNNGDLLIGMDGEFNATLWQGGPALLNQRVCRLHNFKDCLKEYVFYMMRRCLKEIEDNTSAVTVKHISVKQIAAVEIPLPPLEEQRRIVAEIEGYQKVLDGARQILAGYRAQIPDRNGPSLNCANSSRASRKTAIPASPSSTKPSSKSSP